MNAFSRVSISLGIPVILLLSSLAISQEPPSLPPIIPYSGTLHTPNGAARTGTVGITFSIYKDEQGGAALWSESQNILLDEAGHYEVLIGKEKPNGITPDVFAAGEARWLGIEVEGSPEVRARIATVPYAMKSGNAETLGGRPASSYLLVPSERGATQQSSTSGTSTATPHPGEALSSDTGIPNYIAKFSTSSMLGPSQIVETGIGVGVRVPAPEQSLDVKGRLQIRSDGANTAGMWLRGDTAAKVFMGQTGPSSLDQFGIWHNGAWRLLIDNQGNVGVGTLPEYRFDIVGRMRIRSLGATDTAGFWIGAATGNPTAFFGQVGPAGADPIGIWHSGAWRFTVGAQGNIGINVDAQERLDVKGRLRLRPEGTQAAGIWVGAATGNAPIFIGQTGPNTTDPVGIYNGGAWRFAVDATGKVGIGTTQPSATLEVAGQLKLSASGAIIFPDSTTQATAAKSFTLTSSDSSLLVTPDSSGATIQLASGAIGTTKLADASITGAKIADGSITAAKLGSGSVSTTNVIDGAITSSKLAAGAVASTLVDNSLAGSKLADASITSAKIADGSITAAKLGQGIIATNNILDGAITSSKLAPGAVSSVTITDNSLSGSKLMDSSVAGSKLQDSSVSGTKLADTSITAAKLAAGSVTASSIQDGTITSTKIADNSITAAKLSLGTIPPSAVSGTAAILGSNSFLGDQIISGSINANSISVSGSAQLTAANIGSNNGTIPAITAHNDASTGVASALDAVSTSTGARTIISRASASTGSTIAVQGRTDSTSGIALEALAYSSTGSTLSFHGLNKSSSGTVMLAESTATTGMTFGVKATTTAAGGSAAVYGIASATSTTSPTYGARAESASQLGIGVLGYASSMTGTTKAIVGKVESQQGVAGEFTNYGGGDLIAGYSGLVRTFRVDGAGDVWAKGVFKPGGADYAESVAISDDIDSYSPGDVLVISVERDRTFSKSSAAYETGVAGIYSTSPGILGSRHSLNDPAPENEIPLAMVGIVPCKASAENGPIRRGDLLVTSSIPGHVMRGTDRQRMLGAVVGKALQPLDAGTGVIEVLVSLQ